MSEEILLTPEALEKLKEKLDYLKNVKRKDIAQKIHTAKEQGDLSENAEYHDAKDEQGFLEAKIKELENKIKMAVIVEKKDDNSVSLGSTVVVVDEDGNEKKFTIVSFNEASPSEGKISNASPLGSAFLGRSINEEVEVNLPKATKKFIIKGIES